MTFELTELVENTKITKKAKIMSEQKTKYNSETL